MTGPLRRLGARLERYSKKHSRKHLYDWLAEAIEAHCRGDAGVMLNIGSGGNIQAQLERHGIEALSIDVDPARSPDRLMDVEDMKEIPDHSVDVVFCMEVLEHVRNPQRGISEIWRILGDGGVVIGSTPFLLGIHDHPHDYYRFTGFGIDYLFREFEKLVLRPRNSYLEAVSVLCLRLFSIGTRRQKRRAWLLSPILLLYSGLLRALAPLIGSPDGTTGYFFVFRKPLETPSGAATR